MMELNTGLETGIVATGLVSCLAWPCGYFSGVTQLGRNRCIAEMMSPHDDEIDKRLSVPLLLPSLKEGSSKDFITAPDHGVDVLNQRTKGIPLVQHNKAPIESQHASISELQDRKKTVQSKPVQQSLLERLAEVGWKIFRTKIARGHLGGGRRPSY